MNREDFIDGDAWCRYKFEREEKIERIEYLEAKLLAAEKKRFVYWKWWLFWCAATVINGLLTVIQIFV